MNLTLPEDGPHPWWHLPGWCHNSTPRRHRHLPVRAEFWWLAPNGYWFAMCGDCLAEDLLLSLRMPDLAAVRVTAA